MALAKSDLSIARLYSELFPMLLCVIACSDWSRRIYTDARCGASRDNQQELLETNPVLLRSIRLRNPYVDPMSLVQVELLRRKRAGEMAAEIDDALAATMHGISSGLRIQDERGRAGARPLLSKESINTEGKKNVSGCLGRTDRVSGSDEYTPTRDCCSCRVIAPARRHLMTVVKSWAC
jgi:hypothetical protein